ncbi:hypothetical protein OSC27_09830 [Microbacterium sp. STN6]|uniref:hypothetical protein n=1 Tax=Microbacterium sp. STN6 TaxID=2995588 RepID=UPI002260BF75|nr:hypothetical protein [Microbacterium sp. STN6]MCX7522572.1 hypothetical protein [Microbacterium sp. STN6]
MARALLVTIAGLIVSAWIGFGHYLFGIAGALTPLYVFIGVVLFVLHVFLGRAIVLTKRNGYRTRPRTLVIAGLCWACGIICGLTLPNTTAGGGLTTILTGPHEPSLGIAIGVTNPAGIICLGLAVTALVLAYIDVRGGKPRYDEDAILDAQERAAQQ